MFEIEKVFDQVAALKYPDGPLQELRLACKCELYVSLGRAFETDLHRTHTKEEVVLLVASLKLAGPGGTDWSEMAASNKVAELAASVEASETRLSNAGGSGE